MIDGKTLGAIVGGAAAAATLIGIGYTAGLSSVDSEVRAAESAGFERGVRETETKFRDEDRRNQTLASLLAVVRSPQVKQVLPDETNDSIEAAADAVDRGDLEAAAALLPTGVLALAERSCVPVGDAFLVEQGSSIKVCHTWATIALVGHLDGETGELPVSIEGEVKGLLPGFAYKGPGAECDFLFERVVETSDGKAIQASFSC